MRIVTRGQWGARQAKNVTLMRLPQSDVWLHHTAGREPDGPAGVRAVQNFHMDGRGYWDIAYSFVVDRLGTVFEARGAGVAGAHTSGHNSTSHAICLLGDYTATPPTDASLEAVAWLLRHGQTEGWWPVARLAGGHRDVGQTTCPGDRLYARVGDINRLAQQGGTAVREEDPIMRQGDNGPRVAAWQFRIDQLPGVDCTVDGDFGPKTVAATKAAQKVLGLGQDGEVHATEWALLTATLFGRDLDRHADTPHGGEVDLSGYAKKGHRHSGEVTVR